MKFGVVILKVEEGNKSYDSQYDPQENSRGTTMGVHTMTCPLSPPPCRCRSPLPLAQRRSNFRSPSPQSSLLDGRADV